MNQQIIKSISIFLVLTLTASTMLAGGGWPQKKGKGYFKLYQWWIQSDQHYTDAGLIDPNVTTGIFNTTIYGEYGLTDRLTAIISAPIFSRALVFNQVSSTSGEVIVPGDAINGIGDVDIALKYGLTNSDALVAVAGTVLFGLPLGIDQGGVNQNLQTGDGEFNQMLRIDASRSLFYTEKASAYISLYAGYNNRTNQFSDEVRYGAEIGLGLLERRLWLTGRWNGLSSLKNGTLSSDINSTSIFANNTEFQSVTLGAAVYVTEKLGIAADVSPALSGSIILASPSYSFGVFLDLQ